MSEANPETTCNSGASQKSRADQRKSYTACCNEANEKNQDVVSITIIEHAMNKSTVVAFKCHGSFSI
jgi:hypothetical protein